MAGAAALVPCPGVILVFTLVFQIGSYAAGVVSALFMALGMSAVIFLAAIIGFKLNLVKKERNFRLFIELFALCVMALLGAFMLFGAIKGGVF